MESRLQVLSKEGRLWPDPPSGSRETDRQTDRQTRHHRYRGTETERQIHICIQREKSKMSERQRIIHIWAYIALFTTSNCDPSDIYPLTRTFLLSLPKYSPTDNQVLKCQRFVKHLIQSITGVFFNEWHYRAILWRHRNQQLCKSVGLFKFLWNSNSLSVGMRWKCPFDGKNHFLVLVIL